MSEHTSHLVTIAIAAMIGIAGAIFHACDEKLFMLAAAIIGGEYGLAQARGRQTSTVSVSPNQITAKEQSGP